MGGRVVQRLLGFAVVFFTIIASVSGAEAIDIYSAEALRETLLLPAAVFGPVERFHGFQR